MYEVVLSNSTDDLAVWYNRESIEPASCVRIITDKDGLQRLMAMVDEFDLILTYFKIKDDGNAK